MTPISRLVAVSVFAVLVAASSPAALSQAAQGSVDERQEFSSLLAKAEKGDAPSQVMLALVYEFGLSGVAENAAEAVKWYRRAADGLD
jgi:TPR repeat protein